MIEQPLRHMRADHQEIMIAHFRMSPAALRAAVNIHVLAKNIVRADREPGVLAFEFQILWRHTNDAEREKVIVGSNR